MAADPYENYLFVQLGGVQEICWDLLCSFEIDLFPHWLTIYTNLFCWLRYSYWSTLLHILQDKYQSEKYETNTAGRPVSPQAAIALNASSCKLSCTGARESEMDYTKNESEMDIRMKVKVTEKLKQNISQRGYCRLTSQILFFHKETAASLSEQHQFTMLCHLAMRIYSGS